MTALPGWIGAYIVLYMQSPLHVSEILEQMTAAGWSPFKGKTPLQSLRGVLYGKSKVTPAYFENLGKDVWQLTTWGRQNIPDSASTIIHHSNELQPVQSQAELSQRVEQFVLLATSQVDWAITSFCETEFVVFDASSGYFAPAPVVAYNRLMLDAVPTFDTTSLEALVGETFANHPEVSSRFIHWLTNWFGAVAQTALEQPKRFLVLQPESTTASDVSTASGCAEVERWDLEVIQQYFMQNLGDWVWEGDVVQSMHTAWHAFSQRFVILSGLSGAGKSKLLWHYSNAVMNYLRLNPEHHRLWISVQSNFHDPTPLFGFVSVLQRPRAYVRGMLTEFLIRAGQDPERPYFLILDELNLAKVEDYLSPLLSAMEVPAPIVFHQELIDVEGVPAHLDRYPSNIFLGGTMNVEVGSQRLSHRVIDRAFIIELHQIQIRTWLSQHGRGYEAWHDVLIGLYDILVPVQQHFGYRVLVAVFQYVRTASLAHGIDESKVWDRAIYSKVLPKLSANRRIGEQHLLQIAQLLQSHGLSLSAHKLQVMLRQYRQLGHAEFMA